MSQICFIGVTLYMFRKVFPSLTRSLRLYIQQQAYVKQTLLSACCKQAAVNVSLLYVQS